MTYDPERQAVEAREKLDAREPALPDEDEAAAYALDALLIENNRLLSNGIESGWDDGDPGPIPPGDDALPRYPPRGAVTGNALYADVGAFLDGTIPEPPAPTLLCRNDGHRVFYKGELNVVFGDPESGKSWVAEAAASALLKTGGQALVVDLDHNGLESTVSRFIELGVVEEVLRDRGRFRYVEPEDRIHLLAVVADAILWRPNLAIVDSIGELLPLLGYSSNQPDDFTFAHALVFKPLVMCGAGVVAIDHLPKNVENKANGPTGTAAKRRAIGGAAVRVVIKEPFVIGKGGSAYLTLNKDRHGGLRRYCPSEGREPVVGLFTLTAGLGDSLTWEVHAPELGDAAKVEGVSDEDLAELDRLVPPPLSVKDVRERLRWRTARAGDALRHWRDRATPPVTAVTDPLPGNGENTHERTPE